MSNSPETIPTAPADRRPRTRTPRGRLGLALGAVAAAVAVAVALPLAGGSHGTQAAAVSSNASASQGTAATGLDISEAGYTVQAAPGGTVSVKLMNVKGIPGLQAALRKAGIPAAVMKFSASCHTKVQYDNKVDIQKVFPQSTDGRETLIRLSAVPKGEHLLFVATTAADGKVAQLSSSVVRQIPGCVPQSDNGVGVG